MIHLKPKLKESGICNRFLYEKDGERVYVPKKGFKTQDEAINECKRINSKPNQFHKVVPYRCKHCHKYHVGRNGNFIKKDI